MNNFLQEQVAGIAGKYVDLTERQIDEALKKENGVLKDAGKRYTGDGQM